MNEVKYAYGYVRVSTDRQEELSPDSQEKMIREYALQNNIVILKIFFELGISGRKAEKRPEFQQMIGLAKSSDHPVDLILVWKFSRFARNQEESIVYKSLLKKQHNVDVVSISEPLVDGPFGSLIERIIEWMDEYYSIRLSGEVLRGMKEKALQNGYQQVPPLGYTAAGDGKPFLINEEEFKIVEYMSEQFDVYDRDYTAIARDLNRMGYLTRRNRPFEARSIRRILTNPFYYGLVTWNDISFMGSHEVRYSKEQFDKRLMKIQSRYHPDRRHNISSCKHWLSGILKCSKCGCNLAYNGKNNRVPGFQCYEYAKGRHAGSHFISESRLLPAIYEYFEEILNGKDFEVTYLAPERNEKSSEKNLLLEELEKIASRERRVSLAFENGIDTLEEYKQNKIRLKKAREDVQKQLEELDTPTYNAPSKEDAMQKIKNVYDIIKNPDIDYETKGTVMRSLVECIIFDRQNTSLEFHFYIPETLET